MSVQIIAEIGASHGGSVDNALRLARLAAESGADVVKGQAGISELTAKSHPLHDRFAELELDPDEWYMVSEECSKLGVGFAVSIWSAWAGLEYTDATDSFVKVGSGDATHKPTLVAAKATGLPVYLSTGLCTRAEIDASMAALGDSLECLLACTVDYPAAVEDSHIDRMMDLGECGAPKVKIGYSSHCLDWRVPYLATILGANVIEAHFADDPEDDAAALMPDVFRRMVDAIRYDNGAELSADFIKSAVGDGGLGVLECERPWLPIARRDPETGLRR